MTDYLVTGRPANDKISPWNCVTELVSVGDVLTLSLSDPNEALLIGAGVLERIDLTAIASAGTITVEPGLNLVSGTITVESVEALDVGTRSTLIFDDILTFTDGSNLKLGGDMTTSADDTITLVCDGTNWFEEARSAN